MGDKESSNPMDINPFQISDNETSEENDTAQQESNEDTKDSAQSSKTAPESSSSSHNRGVSTMAREAEEGWGGDGHNTHFNEPSGSSDAPPAYDLGVTDGQQSESAVQGSSERRASGGSTVEEAITVEIVDAQKSSDGHTTSTFIAYVIQSSLGEAKRRYSEFEAFRDALVKMFPVHIVPPIPEKHSLGDYAVKQSKAKEDATIIARRRRMLQSFLQRVAQHPTMGQSELFRKFLDGRHQWHEIVTSPPMSNMPKSNLRAPPADVANAEASPAYAALPIPSSSAQLRDPNQRFLDSEAFTDRFASHLSTHMEKVNRRAMKRWTEAGADHAELGMVLNGFSLSETGNLAHALEKIGQAADATFVATGHMLQDWEVSFTEPLHEYSQFAGILQKLLKWRHMKHLQYEYAQEALEAKGEQLGDLEKVESQASRVTSALERGGRGALAAEINASSTSASAPAPGARDSVNAGTWGRSSLYGAAAEEPDAWVGGPGSSASAPASTAASPRSSASMDQPRTSTSSSPPSTARSASASRSGKRFSSNYGLLGALSHTFQSVMDVDPEATRRNNIAKLRDSIAQLEEALGLTEKDLQYATNTIQSDLDRFQRQKVTDFKGMMIAFAKIHREFARVNLEQWKEAKEAVDNLDPPREMPESSLARHQRTEGSAPRKGAFGGTGGMMM